MQVSRLGSIGYQEALDLQRDLVERRKRGEIPDQLLLLEHPDVITLGVKTRSDRTHVLASEASLAGMGVALFETGRGGDVTYHGPGQLVGYPIMRIGDIPSFVHTMEDAIVKALADEGVDAEVRDGLTGIWAGDAKIGSIGVHVNRGVTTHGFAVNVDNDLQPFEWVVPCGLDGVRMTSVAKATGRYERIGCFRKRMAYRFAQAYGMRQRITSLERLARTPALV
jgi:lipoate-protein ligase B